MSNSKNNVNLIGRITKDPELKYTQQKNQPAVAFTLAVDQNYKNPDGSRSSDFPYCVVYGKSAEFMANYIRKGDMISIQGELRTRTYENNGQKIFHTEVVCRDVQPLESKTRREERNGALGAPPATQPDNYNNGYNGNNGNNGYNGNNGNNYPPSPMTGMGTDIPFDEEVPF